MGTEACSSSRAIYLLVEKKRKHYSQTLHGTGIYAYIDPQHQAWPDRQSYASPISRVWDSYVPSSEPESLVHGAEGRPSRWSRRPEKSKLAGDPIVTNLRRYILGPDVLAPTCLSVEHIMVPEVRYDWIARE